MTYAGNGSRPISRVLISLVVVTIIAVAAWAMSGGLDQIQSPPTETASVSE